MTVDGADPKLTLRGLHPRGLRAAMANNQHLARFLDIAKEPDPVVRVRLATEEMDRLEAEREDFATLRREAVRKASMGGQGYGRIAAAVGLTKGRIAQLVGESKLLHGADAQHVARVKRRAARRGIQPSD